MPKREIRDTGGRVLHHPTPSPPLPPHRHPGFYSWARRGKWAGRRLAWVTEDSRSQRFCCGGRVVLGKQEGGAMLPCVFILFIICLFAHS